MDSVKKGKEIYTKTFETYGDDTRSCMWAEPMIMRYSMLKEIIPDDLEGKRILEIGCGLGGFYHYLVKDCEIKNLQYTGVDIVEGMIETAQKKYPDAKFMVADVFQEKLQETFDYCVICGMFNTQYGDDWEFMKKMLKVSYDYCEKGIAFNFISSYVNFKSEGTSYHEPQKVFSFCLENLSRKVNMYHHYKKCDVAMYV